MNTVTTKEAVIIKTDATMIVTRDAEEKDALTRVQNWVIKTAEDFSALDRYLVGLLDLKKLVKADFADSIEKAAEAKKTATAAHKAIVDQEAGHLGTIDEARRLGKNKLDAWEQEQRRETERLQAIENAKAKKISEDAAIAAAALIEKTGDHEKAESVLSEFPLHVAPRVESKVPERATVISTRWGATVTDPLYVLKAIEAAGKILAKSKTEEAKNANEMLRQAYIDAKYMVYDQIALNRQAVATKDALRLGGVQFSPKKV